MAKKTAPKKIAKAEKSPAPVAAQVHPLICPFSGKPLEIRMVGDNLHLHFMVVSPHGFTSKLMKTKEQCLEWASFRAGSPTYSSPRLVVSEREAPDTSAEEGLRTIMPNPDDIDDADLPESIR